MGGFNIGGGFGGFFGSGAVNAVTRANNSISATNAKAGNDTRDVSNLATAAKGNLQRFAQSVNNNRILKQAGSAQEALVVNYLRGRDTQDAKNFSGDIQNAEQAGHAAASAAVSGVDGNVVDMVNYSTALRNSIVAGQVDKNQSQQAFDESKRAGNIASQMVQSLDSSLILDHLDYNVDYAQNKPEQSKFSQTLNGFFQGAQWYSQRPTGTSNAQTTDSAPASFDQTSKGQSNADKAGVNFNPDYGNEGRNSSSANSIGDDTNENQGWGDMSFTSWG